MKYNYLALDVDGTLVDSQKIISEKNKAAIQKANIAGVKIILTSGRPTIGIQSIAAELQFPWYGGYILAYNGGEIIDSKAGNIIDKRTIPMEYVEDICSFGKMFSCSVLTYDENGIVTENENDPYVLMEAYNNSIPIHGVVDLSKRIVAPVAKFMLVGKEDKLQFAYHYLQKRYFNKLNVFFSEPYFLEIMPLGIEKASGLHKLLMYLNGKPEELLVCGDGLNDISMFQYAGFAVAMENACCETKKYADYVTVSNDNDGVAVAVEKFVLEGV